MGGYGSGNHLSRWNKKTTVEQCLCIDANRWIRQGILRLEVNGTGTWSWSYRDGSTTVINYQTWTSDLDRPYVLLSYTRRRRSAGETERVVCPVDLTATQPQFG